MTSSDDHAKVTAGSTSMKFHQRFSYGVGRVFNDLCTAMWLSYLLVYFTKVHNFSNTLAGNLQLIGQITNAVGTPLVGIEVDRTSGFCGYTKRKSWHLFGTFCTLISFPFIFTWCLVCNNSAEWAEFIYYAPFVIVFQFGWAAIQIPHLSLIHELTPSKHVRTELNSIRYAFTVLSNCTVYGITYFVLNDDSSGGGKLSQADSKSFMIISLIIVAIGMVFTLIFHCGTPEPKESSHHHHDNHYDHSSIENFTSHMNVTDWFREPQFYQLAFIYMCTRFTVNMSQTYLPLYLTDTLNAGKADIAVIPLIGYLCGFACSFVMKPMNKYAGRKITYSFGIFLILGASVWFLFLDDSNSAMVYGPAALQGVGTTTLLITGLSMTSDLIGDHVESGAFVYGLMSMLDKVSNGFGVLLIQQFNPCEGACPDYMRNILVFVPGGVAMAALLMLLTLARQRIGDLNKDMASADDDSYLKFLYHEAPANENMPLLNSDRATPIRMNQSRRSSYSKGGRSRQSSLSTSMRIASSLSRMNSVGSIGARSHHNSVTWTGKEEMKV